MKFVLFAFALFLALIAPARGVTVEPTPIVLRSAAPGYLQIDGRWYAYEAPFGSPTPTRMATSAQPGRGGFFSLGFLSGRNCQRASGGAVSTANTLQHAESVSAVAAGAIPLARKLIGGTLRATISLVSCPGNVVVMQLTSVHGDLVCSGGITKPFATGECRAVDGPNAVFGNGFERP